MNSAREDEKYLRYYALFKIGQRVTDGATNSHAMFGNTQSKLQSKMNFLAPLLMSRHQLTPNGMPVSNRKNTAAFRKRAPKLWYVLHIMNVVKYRTMCHGEWQGKHREIELVQSFRDLENALVNAEVIQEGMSEFDGCPAYQPSQVDINAVGKRRGTSRASSKAKGQNGDETIGAFYSARSVASQSDGGATPSAASSQRSGSSRSSAVKSASSGSSSQLTAEAIRSPEFKKQGSPALQRYLDDSSYVLRPLRSGESPYLNQGVPPSVASDDLTSLHSSDGVPYQTRAASIPGRQSGGRIEVPSKGNPYHFDAALAAEGKASRVPLATNQHQTAYIH
jgi:hypothetical protein